jgi:hypothetical protein
MYVKGMDTIPSISGIGVSIKHITAPRPIFFLKDFKILKFFVSFFVGLALRLISIG